MDLVVLLRNKKYTCNVWSVLSWINTRKDLWVNWMLLPLHCFIVYCVSHQSSVTSLDIQDTNKQTERKVEGRLHTVRVTKSAVSALASVVVGYTETVAGQLAHASRFFLLKPHGFVERWSFVYLHDKTSRLA